MMDFTTVDKTFYEAFDSLIHKWCEECGLEFNGYSHELLESRVLELFHSQIEKALEDKAREVEKYVLDLPLKDKYYVSLQGVLDGIRGVKHDHISLLRGKVK